MASPADAVLEKKGMAVSVNVGVEPNAAKIVMVYSRTMKQSSFLKTLLTINIWSNLRFDVHDIVEL